MISIHALREEGDGKTGAESIPMLISIHALREEGDPVFHLVRSNHVTISIHALREEGDIIAHRIQRFDEISIHALREEGDAYRVFPKTERRISIHALREEGDAPHTSTAAAASHFYPRPPRGGRHKHALVVKLLKIFLSTPSARRATVWCSKSYRASSISIHALREEGDPRSARTGQAPANFYPRPPRGGRRRSCIRCLHRVCISIHALREEGDLKLDISKYFYRVFLSTPSARRATTAAGTTTGTV